MSELFYDSLIQYYVDNTRFVQRQWLTEKIESALSDPDCRYLLLTGEPGSGKTAFMAYLARQHPDWPRYFIRRDSQTPLSSGDARSFLFTIGHQLATLHPSLFAPERLEIAITQRIGELKASGKATALTIEELQTSPFYTTSIRVLQDAKIVAGDLEGLSINRVVAEKRFLELENLQYLALLDPAELLKTEKPEAKIFIILDALDELRYYIGRDSILDWLASCPPLQSNVKFLITSRPEKMLKILQDRQKTWIKEVSIDPKSTLVETDLRRYTSKFINEPNFRQALTICKIPQDQFTKSAVQKSDGNFQYLTSLLRGIEEAIPTNKPDQLDRLLKFEDIPLGLENLYSFFLNLIKNNLPTKTIEIQGDSPFTFTQVGAWEGLYQPVLGVLSVAREPLTPTQISGFIGFKGEKRLFQGALERLTQFMDSLGESYRLYHTTLAEFLTSEKTQKNNPQWYLDPTEWNRKIAAYYRGKATTWDEVDWNKTDNYGILHLPAHIYAMRNMEINDAKIYYAELSQLICKSWIAQKFIRFGSYATLLSDVELAANASLEQETPDIAKLAGFAVARETLKKIMVNFPMELLQVWVRLGETQRVLPLVKSLGIVSHAFDALITVAQELLTKPLTGNTDSLADKTSVKELLQRAILIMPLLGSSSEKIEAFEKLTQLLSSPLWPEENQLNELRKCRNLAESFTDPALKASCLSLIATAIAGIETHKQEAKDIVQNIRNTISNIAFLSDRNFSLIYLLPALEKTDPEAILPTIEDILKDPHALLTSSSLGKNTSLRLLKKWPVTKTEPKRTLDLIEKIIDFEIKHASFYGEVCGEAANLLCDMGKVPEAFSIIEKARKLSPLNGAWATIIAAQNIYAQNPNLTLAWLVESGKCTANSYHDLLINKEMFTENLAYSFAIIGKWKEAISYIKKLAPKMHKKEAVCSLITLAGNTLKNNLQLINVISQLTAHVEEEEPEAKAKIYATAARALTTQDAISATPYEKQAVKISLSQLPEGETDNLRHLLAIGMQEEGNYDTALTIAKAMKWETSTLKTINELIKTTPPTNTVQLTKCARAILQILQKEDIQLIPSVVKLVTEAAEKLSQNLPLAARQICDSAVSIIFSPKFKLNYDEVIQCIAQEAAARTKFDRQTGLAHFDHVIDLAEQALNKKIDVRVSALATIFKNLGALSEPLPRDALPRLLKAHALAAFYPELKEKVKLESAFATALAPINQTEAFKILQEQNQAVADLSKSPPPALHIFRMLTEFLGKHAGPNYVQTETAEALGIAIFSVTKHNPTKANEIIKQLIDVISDIRSPEDRAQAIADLFSNCPKAAANPELLPSVRNLALTKLAALLDGELEAFVAKKAVEMFCGFEDIASAKIVARQLGGKEEQKLLTTIESAEDWLQVTKLGKLTPMEQAFISGSRRDGRFGMEGAILHCIKVEGTSIKALKMLAEGLAKGTGYFQVDRAILLDDRMKAIMPLARVMGGTRLMSDIVQEIEKVDKLFIDAAATIAQQ